MLTLHADRKLDVRVEPLENIGGTVYFGTDDPMLPALEILLISAANEPTAPEIREVYKWRKNNRTRSIVIAIEARGRVHMYGPAEDRQPAKVDSSTASRILQSALLESSPITARKNLIDFYDNFGNSEMAGIKNKGLFATHHLRENLPQRKDWKDLQAKGKELATKRHHALIEALGFTVAGEERNTLILKASGPENRVVAVLLDDAENFDSPSGRFPSSPVAWGLSVAADHNVPWLIVLKKDQIRLHPGRDGVGVGQKGQAETFLELNLAQIDSDHLALLPLIFSAHALKRDGDVQQILDESSKYAVVLGARLRERVYESVVPQVSIAVAKQLQQQGLELDSEGLQKAYSIALRIIFRLLFQAYAEDRGLLPAGRNEGYDANSLKAVAKRDIDAKPEDFSAVVNIWCNLVEVWDAIDQGNRGWQVPAYNGGLFGSDPELHPEGALIKGLDLPDSVMGPALQALLIDQTEDDVKGPVDFRSLSVREFGTIYEGLLESSLSLAEVDLTIDAKDAWVPAQPGDTVMVYAGEPYFHSASGERKATGSYFTPKFVVDHLVEKAIDPTLDKHLEKIKGYLESGDQATANREFFDFRVADLAMGSAHFLVAAVDRIEAKMRAFLSNPENSVPGVIDEISRLRKTATEKISGDEIAIADIEDSSLLRRQIARRCIYGIDINPMAVELARLAIWIHTFVPGLPMSTLNHNLVCANSLTGIGSTEEALDVLIPNRASNPGLFGDAIFNGLEKAKALLIDAANASEADKKEASRGAQLALEAREIAQSSKLVFDAAVAVRLGLANVATLFSELKIAEIGTRPDVQELLDILKPAHMPYLFPEVFLRNNSGFDALVGNPPWEKTHVDKPTWWAIHAPEMRGLKDEQLDSAILARELERPDLKEKFAREVRFNELITASLMSLNFPGIGKSHVDLFQLFAWRNWGFIRTNGRFGLVMPRNSVSGPSLEEWRREIISTGTFESVLFAQNKGGWVFPSIAHQIVVVFCVVAKTDGTQVQYAPVLTSRTDFEHLEMNSVYIDANELVNWSTTGSFPTLQSKVDIEIYRQVSLSPSLSNWDKQVRPVSEFNSTTNRSLFRLTQEEADSNCSPLNAGATFQLWDPRFGAPFAYGKTQQLLDFLESRLVRQLRSKATAFYGVPLENLNPRPWDKPRIFFRDIARSSDPRTGIFCLMPSRTFSLEGSPYLFINQGTSSDEAYLIGVFSSIIFDWICRQWVDLHFKFYIIQGLPVPSLSKNLVLANRIRTISARLLGQFEELYEWAESVETLDTSVLTDVEKESLLAELDAVVSLCYGLHREQVQHIFSNFRTGWDYKPRLKKVLEYYEKWKDKA